MPFALFLSLLPAFWTLASSEESADGPPVVRRVIIQDELILRIPVRPSLPPARLEWVPVGGPSCLASGAIRGAALSEDGDVDFMLSGAKRVRAKLADDCPGLDFYKGFYMTPEDDRICAGRDVIRSRIGGSCRIERFERLVPRRGRSP